MKRDDSPVSVGPRAPGPALLPILPDLSPPALRLEPLRPKLTQEQIDGIRTAIIEARSDNTRRARAKVLRKLLAWVNAEHPECIREDHDWPDNLLPLHPETVADFLRRVRVDPPEGHRPGDPLPARPSYSTLAQYLSVIRQVHRFRGYSDPGAHPGVSEAWEGIKREVGTHAQGAAPLTKRLLYLVLDACAEQDDDDRAARDRALLLIGFYGAFRRSELCAFCVRDAVTDDRGLLLFLPRSKTDQEGAGATIEIQRLPESRYCPVEALEAWRLVLDRLDPLTPEGAGRPLFRAWSWPPRRGLRITPMSPAGVNFVIQAAIDRAGLTGRLSAHSLRSGFATEAAERGLPIDALMAQGRWKTPEMAIRYIKRRRGANPAVALVGAD